MEYYCKICKKLITIEVFRYSMNKYKKPLCKIHQKEEISVHTQNKLSYHTKSLQDLIKKRHNPQKSFEEIDQRERPQSIKDWINADTDTWDKILKKIEKKKD